MTANNAIRQRRLLKVTSMTNVLCGLVMANVGQPQRGRYARVRLELVLSGKGIFHGKAV